MNNTWTYSGGSAVIPAGKNLVKKYSSPNITMGASVAAFDMLSREERLFETVANIMYSNVDVWVIHNWSPSRNTSTT